MLDTAVPYTPANRRLSHRVTSEHQAPILISIDNRWIPLIDISTGGISFRSYRFSKGDWYYADIDLPGEEETLSAIIEIAEVSKDEVCHCRFKSISSREKAVVARYVHTRKTI